MHQVPTLIHRVGEVPADLVDTRGRGEGFNVGDVFEKNNSGDTVLGA